MPPPFHTPPTILTWATLGEWLACARTIERRRAGRLRNLQAELHVRALPVTLIYQCSGRATLVSCDRLLRQGPTHFCQPPRGQRQNAPQTALIVAIANRVAQLDRPEDHASISPGHNSRGFRDPLSRRPLLPAAVAAAGIRGRGPKGDLSEEEDRKGIW